MKYIAIGVKDNKKLDLYVEINLRQVSKISGPDSHLCHADCIM